MTDLSLQEIQNAAAKVENLTREESLFILSRAGFIKTTYALKRFPQLAIFVDKDGKLNEYGQFVAAIIVQRLRKHGTAKETRRQFTGTPKREQEQAQDRDKAQAERGSPAGALDPQQPGDSG